MLNSKQSGSKMHSHYRSDEIEWLSEFYQKYLPSSRIGYWRASAYFSSALYAHPQMKKSILKMIQIGGSIRLLTSNRDLSEKDVDAAIQGYNDREIKPISREEFIEILEHNQAMKGSEMIYWLVRSGIMDWKVITEVNGKNNLYHEKIGLFLRSHDDFSYFIGSLNESLAASIYNHESVNLTDTTSEQLECEEMKRKFISMWEGANNRLTTQEIQIAKIIFRKSTQSSKGNTNTDDEEGYVEEDVVDVIQELSLREYQEKAVNAFLSPDGKKGILSMATGTGKTRTANWIMKHLFESGEIDSAIVCVENVPVLEQWREKWQEMRDIYGLKQIKNIFLHYGGHKQMNTFAMNPKNKLLLIGRNNPKNLATLLRRLNSEKKKKLLLIHDEVHGLGSPGCLEHLEGHTEGVNYVLGLSATWERYDEQQNEFICNELGGKTDPIYEYTLENAIKDGWLIEFDYLPLEYCRSVQDAEEYQKHLDGAMPWQFEGVYKSTHTKVEIFKNWIQDNTEKAREMLNSCVFFCKTRAQGEKVANEIVGAPLYFEKAHQYYSQELEDQERDAFNVLERFVEGELTTLITAGKIDQGFDMPELMNIVLMESDSSDAAERRRKLVQRIGRMLRKDPKNPEKRGFILDFVRVIKDDGYPETPENYEDGDRESGKLLTGISVFDLHRMEWLTEVSKIKGLEGND